MGASKIDWALRAEDQRAFDDLFAAARANVAACAHASHAPPFEVMLLAMLIEEQKEAIRSRERVKSGGWRAKASEASAR